MKKKQKNKKKKYKVVVDYYVAPFNLDLLRKKQKA